MASPAPPIADPQALETLPSLTDGLLEDIFLRLPTAADIARVSASCPSFRRIITDRSFLRRFRAIHPPPLLGFVAYEGFHPAQPPHPSATLARAFADAADFSYSFVPTGRWLTPWHPRDVRQGRVLLECTPECEPELEYFDAVFLQDLELAVCDPISRRYRLLPRVPNKLIRAHHKTLADYGLFFAPTGEDEETTFRVVCIACNETNLVAFEYTSTAGQWNIRACLSWRSSVGSVTPCSRYSSFCLDYEKGCFYWVVPWRNKFVVLDGLSMKLSVVNNDLVNYNMCESGKPLIVMGEDGTAEVFFVSSLFGDGPTDLFRFTKETDGGSSDEWKFENMVPLPSRYHYFTLGAFDGFFFLRVIPQDQHSGYSSEDSGHSSEDSLDNSAHLVEHSSEDSLDNSAHLPVEHSSEDSLDNSAHLPVESPNVEYFSYELKTSELKKVCVMKQYYHTVYPYYGYPPPLAEPTI